MRKIHMANNSKSRIILWCLALCLMLGMSTALADGVLPKMPEPPQVPVYWQLSSIDLAPEMRPSGGYSVEYDVIGMELDLSDGLLTASLLENDDAAQGITLYVEKNDEVIMEHAYLWTPLPIYIEPNTTYPIHVNGARSVGSGNTPNTLLGIYVQGEQIARISAGGYTGHTTSASFDVSTGAGLYKDGSLVISFVLRDVNEMYRNRIVYTYTMQYGIKPEPTPIPGFVAVDMPEDTEIPSFYTPVEGQDGVWSIVTEPEAFRAYGSMSGSEPMFFPSDGQGNVVMDEAPAIAQNDFEAYVEGFVAESPDSLPDHYYVDEGSIYAFTTRDGDTVRRAFGRIDGGEPAFYPTEEDGSVSPDTEAADPVADYETHIEGFGDADLPQAAPLPYIDDGDGRYRFIGRGGIEYFRAYGRLDGAEPAFYPADADGNPVADAQAVTPEADFDNYVKGFDAIAPDTVPDYYAPITESFFEINDREGNPEFRVFGIKDGTQAAFFPADENANLLDGDSAAPIDPQEDFDAYVAGFENDTVASVPDYYEATEVEGVYGFIDKDGQSHYRVFGSLNRGGVAFYPADAEGAVEIDALPVEPASDLAIMPPPVFAPQTPSKIPDHYTKISDSPLVYGFIDLNGEEQRRVFGAYGKGEPAFYPADENDEPVEGAEAISPAHEYRDVFGGFTTQPPQSSSVPSYYAPVEGKSDLFSITDMQGNTIYRVYGSNEEGKAPSFYPADASGNILTGEQADISAEYDSLFDAFTPETPAQEDIPKHYAPVEGKAGLFSFSDKDGQPQYRLYGETKNGETAFLPADKNGTITSGQAANPEKEYTLVFGAFSLAEPAVLPNFYQKADDEKALYAFENNNGDTEYRVYGQLSKDAEPGFFPANAEGEIISTETIEPDAEYAEAFSGFAPAAPDQVPARYAPVEGSDTLFRFTDSAGNAHYRVFGALVGNVPAFYPATETGEIISGKETDPEADERAMPMVVSHAVRTPEPKPEVETTPLIRIKEEGVSRWNDPHAPQPTQYISTIVPAQTGSQSTPTGIVRIFTPAPDATAEPLPTEYSATIIAQQTAQADGNVQITSFLSAPPDETEAPLPTEYSAAILTPEETGAGENPTVTSLVTADFSETDTIANSETAAPVATSDAAISTAQASEETPAAVDASATPQEDTAAQKGGLPWWVILLIILLLVAIILWILLSRKKKDTEDTSAK